MTFMYSSRLTSWVRAPMASTPVQLRLQPGRVLLLALQDLLEHLPAAVVSLVTTQRDALVEPGDGQLLLLERQLELLGHVLADAHRSQPLEVGDALEIEDAVDELLGVAHLLHRLFPHAYRQPVVP